MQTSDVGELSVVPDVSYKSSTTMNLQLDRNS